MTEKFEEALSALDLALARAHMRHNRNGTVSMVNAYQRIVPGDYLKRGDTVIDSFGKKRKVTDVDSNTVTFDDFTKQPINSPFRVINSESDTEKAADEQRTRRMNRAKKQDPFKADVKDPFVNKAPLSSALSNLEVVLSKAQTPRYEKVVKGKDVLVGDIVIDESGKTLTVISVTPSSVIFSDFSAKPLDDFFRVEGDSPEPPKPATSTNPQPTPVEPVPAVSPVPPPAPAEVPMSNDGDEDVVELASTKVEGHMRRSKSGKMYHVDSYIRRTSGHDLKVGDVIRDTYGKQKKVTGTGGQNLTFNDGSSSPKKSKFEVIQTPKSAPKPQTTTNKWSDLAPRAIPSAERKQRASKAADKIVSKATKAEPSLTAFIKKEVEKLGASLAGLENKFKPHSEIAQKLEKKSLERNASPESQASKIKDSIQYTVLHDNAKLVETAEALHSALSGKGHSVLATRNSWSKNSPYRGIHSSVVSPDGNYYEIQFHTPESYKAKQEANDAFQIIHDLNTPLRLRQLRWQRLMNIWLNVPFPLYWQRLGRLQYYNSPIGPPGKDVV